MEVNPYVSAALFLLSAGLLLFFGGMHTYTQVRLVTSPVVAVDGEVVETSSRMGATRGGSVPVARIRDEIGQLHWVDGRSTQVGDDVTVYRGYDGIHRWDPSPSPSSWLIGLGLTTLAVPIGLFGVRDMRYARRRSVRVRSAAQGDPPAV